MNNLRTEETQRKYDELKALRKSTGATNCVLCDKEASQLFTFWKIISNDFPYDRISKKQDMLVPLRHIKEQELMQEEREELLRLKETVINEDYAEGFIMEAPIGAKSIPAHFHLQIIIFRDSLYQN